jgi:hypothetical protein
MSMSIFSICNYSIRKTKNFVQYTEEFIGSVIGVSCRVVMTRKNALSLLVVRWESIAMAFFASQGWPYVFTN